LFEVDIVKLCMLLVECFDWLKSWKC